MKKFIVITGGAGFVGSNLIIHFIKKTNFNIISIDNYSSGSKKNHFRSKKIKYINGNTVNIKNILKRYKNKINCLFHFGEFSRIHQSFDHFNLCYDTNNIGSKEVFKFCLDNNIKLIYSATSASLGNGGADKDLSPYSFTKAKNLELLENFRKWYKFKYEIIYFYNVYGHLQIETGKMATVIGIFQNQFKKNKLLTVVKPGTQTRRFTHISDTINICFKAWKLDKCRHYSISHKKSYSIIDVAKMFNRKFRYLPSRKGERYVSTETKKLNKKKILSFYGKINLKDYITSFINNHK